MGRASREKGAVAEREAAALIRTFGFDANRDSDRHDLYHNVPGVHFEVKRAERLVLPDWTRQAEQDAGDQVAVVMYRRNREPWRVSLVATEYLRLKALEARCIEVAGTMDGLNGYIAAILDPEWPSPVQP